MFKYLLLDINTALAGCIKMFVGITFSDYYDGYFALGCTFCVFVCGLVCLFVKSVRFEKCWCRTRSRLVPIYNKLIKGQTFTRHTWATVITMCKYLFLFTN